MNRILVIRGGAIGDFVLTLPAIKLLRDRFPQAHLEILGYPHITALAHERFYADSVRSIEDASLAPFFSKHSTLPQALVDHFGGLDLIVSYLFDPDAIFETNLRKCGINRFIIGPPKLSGEQHGAVQLARCLKPLNLELTDPGAVLYPTEADREFARAFLGHVVGSLIVIHPGSGSETKNWPIENWRMLGEQMFSHGYELLVVSGEADEGRVASLESAWKGKLVRFAKNLALPRLAALFENTIFIGHDSGISHIAAAVGARCFLLFGPTNPGVWAPANHDVVVICAPGQDLRSLSVETVIAAVLKKR